jgi:hypothetical protein
VSEHIRELMSEFKEAKGLERNEEKDCKKSQKVIPDFRYIHT